MIPDSVWWLMIIITGYFAIKEEYEEERK